MRRFASLVPLAAALLTACASGPGGGSTAPPPPEPSPPPPAASPAPVAALPTAPKLDRVPRTEWNRLAAELDLPLFWIADTNRSGAIDPDELAALWSTHKDATVWVKDGRFTSEFLAAYDAVAGAARGAGATPPPDEAEKRRRAAVLAELRQGRPSLVRTDLRAAPAEDRALVGHILAAAAIVERIYAKQRGSFGMDGEIPAGDTASRKLFERNQGPWCEAPKTEKDPDCNALARRPPKISGLYPASLQKDPKFCQTLEARKDSKALLTPFTVVVEKGGALEAVPYHVAYKADMEAVSRELVAAAEALGPSEAALEAYLLADAQAFKDGSWEAADEAWAKMSSQNSKWYLRLGPDEVYFEPCSQKAGMHVSFARINQGSVAWQKKLEPVKADMEGALAKLAGAPYKARAVTFHLPDFIDIVLNAGDARQPIGATIGQSLPNWGPVANESRGRTVAMTNLYTDPDSEAAFREQTESAFCKASMAYVTFDPSIMTMTTVLHEATHNLGPSAEYKVAGKKDSQIFGGALASTLEELKAQTGAFFFTDWLADKGVVDKATAARAHGGDVAWAFGHIAQGVYDAEGKPKPYSQLASIQIGWLRKAGAITFKPEELAANGKDKGCFELDLAKFQPAIVELGKVVLGIKARGDKAAAIKLREELVDKEDDWKKLRAVIQERWLRAPKASFVYAIER